MKRRARAFRWLLPLCAIAVLLSPPPPAAAQQKLVERVADPVLDRTLRRVLPIGIVRGTARAPIRGDASEDCFLCPPIRRDLEPFAKVADARPIVRHVLDSRGQPDPSRGVTVEERRAHDATLSRQQLLELLNLRRCRRRKRREL